MLVFSLLLKYIKFMIKVFTAFSGYDSQCLALNVLRDKWSANKVFNQDGTVRYGVDFDYELVG